MGVKNESDTLGNEKFKPVKEYSTAPINNTGFSQKMPGIVYGKVLDTPKDATLKGAASLGSLYKNYSYDPESIKKVFTGAAEVEGRAGINAAQGLVNSSDQGYTQQMALARAAAEKERNSAVMSGASSGMQALAGMDARNKADQAFTAKRLEALQGVKKAQDNQGVLNAKALQDAFAETQRANEKLMTTDSANYAVDASTQQAKLGYNAQVSAANTAGSASANNSYGNVLAADLTGRHNENAASIAGNASMNAANINAESYKYSADQNRIANDATVAGYNNQAALQAKTQLAQLVMDAKFNINTADGRKQFNDILGTLGIELPGYTSQSVDSSSDVGTRKQQTYTTTRTTG